MQTTVPPAREPQEPSRRHLLELGLAALAAGAAPAVLGAASSSTPTMRPRPTRQQQLASGLSEAPRTAIVAFNRMAFGPRPGDLAAFNALGGTSEERLAAYVAQQLDPQSIDDTTFENRLAAAGYESVGLDPDPDVALATLWDWYINDHAPNGNTSSSIPRDELVRVTFLRAIHSRRQLVEVLADFWRDHFNVNIDESSVLRVTTPHLDQVIRQHLLGNFRALLEAVARSPAMLYYLDNYTSSNGGPNENFSRELFELHALGAENYLGVRPQHEIPRDAQGRPLGYVDGDVFEATRCFTGWSFSLGIDNDGDNGLFHYRSEWHDRFQKNVLGKFIPPDQPALKDGRDVLDALASHPGTGRHIARKLCRRLIADEPPASVVDAAATVFTDHWQAPDQLRRVVETILLSPEFRTTWGEKIKRPFDIAVSALRAVPSTFVPLMDHSPTRSFLSRYDEAGQPLFKWPAPNGYPDVRDAWKRMSPRLMSWRLVGWLVDFKNESDGFYLDILGKTPSTVRTANQLADFWIGRVLGRPMLPGNREELVEFMAQGINPDFELNLEDKDTCDRLRVMVGLIFMSPEFLWR